VHRKVPVGPVRRKGGAPKVLAVSIWTSLEPTSTTVDPGTSVTIKLRLRNTTDLVEEYRVGVVGGPAVWAGVEPQTLRLYPGTSGTVDIAFQPPRSPDATAGGHPFAVEVTPTEQPGLKSVVEGHLTVTPFTEIQTELVPPSVRGRLRGKPKLAVDNYGNTTLTASLTGKDTGGRLGFELHPANVQIEPGRAAWVRGRIKPESVTWFGQRESHPYTVRVLRSGMEPLDVEGTYVQPAVMPRWLLVVGSLVLAMTLAFAVAWLTFQPTYSSRTRESAISPAGNPLPIAAAPSAEPHSETPTPKATAAPHPKQPSKKHSAPAPHPHAHAGSAAGGGSHGPTVRFTRSIVSYASGRCIDVPGSDGSDGTPLQIWDCIGSPGQRWSFMSDGTIRSLGFCLDVAWANSADGTQIQIARCNGNQAQHFVLSEAADLVNVGANKCVDVRDNQTANATRLQLWQCAGTANQKWYLV
jgi:Ricin-type beta-trefoil lectin domain